jgi:hypothetical protein
MAPQPDTHTLYVLVSSLAGTVLSLAATWIFVAHSVQSSLTARIVSLAAGRWYLRPRGSA